MRASDPWLPLGRPNGQARVRLFCLPYAGAGASVYYGWRPALPAAIDLCPVQIPGRETRLQDPPLTCATRLADAMFTALRDYLDMPFALFGHSMGALICYEFARRVEAAGLSPAHLFVSAWRAPHIARRGVPIHILSDAALVQLLRGFGETPDRILLSPEWQQLTIPLMRADCAMTDGYVWNPGIPLRANLSAFAGAADPHVHLHEIDAWRAHTRGVFRIHMFPGNHFFIKSARRMVVELICRELADSLRRGQVAVSAGAR